MTVLELPFPISVNALYRSVKGRNILSKQARQWKEQAGWMIAAQKAQRHTCGGCANTRSGEYESSCLRQ